MTKTRIFTVCGLVCAVLLASCANTVRGVSRDVKDTASAVEDAVK
jgi:predicted small secreted protein